MISLIMECFNIVGASWGRDFDLPPDTLPRTLLEGLSDIPMCFNIRPGRTPARGRRVRRSARRERSEARLAARGVLEPVRV